MVLVDNSRIVQEENNLITKSCLLELIKGKIIACEWLSIITKRSDVRAPLHGCEDHVVRNE